MSSRRDPFDEIERTLERLTRQLDTDFGGLAAGSRGPATDIAESENDYTVVVDLPGYDRDEISVTADDETLTIRAEREESQAIEEDDYVRRERSHQEVHRTVRLPGPVEESDASASYANGVLTVTLPKRTGTDEGESIEVQ